MTGGAPTPTPGPAGLWALRRQAAAHLVIAIAAVPVALLVRGETGGAPLGGNWLADPLTAGLMLVIGQVVSCGRYLSQAHAPAYRTTRQLRRSASSIALAMCATFSAPYLQLTGRVPAWLWALFLLLVVAALLLEYRYATRVHRCLDLADQHTAVAHHRPLPPRAGRRLRGRHGAGVACHAVFGGLAALLLVATTGAETRGSAGAVIQIGAAVAAVAVPLLHVRALLLARAAVVGDALHLPALRRAGASFVRAGRAGAVLAAFVVASVAAAPADPDIAVVRAALLALVVGAGALQFAFVAGIRVGDFPRRWLRP